MTVTAASMNEYIATIFDSLPEELNVFFADYQESPYWVEMDNLKSFHYLKTILQVVLGITTQNNLLSESRPGEDPYNEGWREALIDLIPEYLNVAPTLSVKTHNFFTKHHSKTTFRKNRIKAENLLAQAAKNIQARNPQMGNETKQAGYIDCLRDQKVLAQLNK